MTMLAFGARVPAALCAARGRPPLSTPNFPRSQRPTSSY
jgi:hypothetical protein